MSFILKFIIFIFAALFFLSLILGTRVMVYLLRLLFGPKRTYTNNHQQRQQQNNSRTREPESQEDRIMSYQKKHFETSQAEDVEFEEIKDEKNK